MPIASCPDPADLERLFLGGLATADIDALEEHILGCDACSGRLERLFLAKETLAVVLCDKTCNETQNSDPVVVDLMKKLESLRPTHGQLPQGKPMIAFTCSSCQTKLTAKENLAGKNVKCPGCGELADVPAALVVGAAGAEEVRTQPPSLELSADALVQPDLSESPTHPPEGNLDATMVVKRDARLDSSLTDFLGRPQTSDELGRLGKYRILKILGHGGMGVVYKAEDPMLERSVAIKAMLPTLAASASAGKRFLREAQAMAKVEHDHIVRIYQVDEDRGVPFFAMEFLKGEPLDERLKRDAKMPLEDILRIGRETAEALGAAHATGLIHRDIKPANIWLEAPRERVKILDFGLARAATLDSGLTQQGAIVGTPAYMSPEQGRGDNVDARCDLFSLGVVLYRICTGQQPFIGKDMVSTLMAVAMTDPVAPARLDKALPKELSKLVMKLLEKDPANRIASASEVVQAIQEIEKDLAMRRLAEEQTDPMSAGDRKHAITAAPKRTVRPSPRATKEPSVPSRRPLALIGAAFAAVFALVCLLGGGVFYIVTDKGTIEIKTDDPNVKIIAEENGGKITILDPAGKQTWILNTGKYTIRLDGNPDGLEIDLPADRTFKMERGGKQVVSVRKVPAPVAKVEPKKADGSPSPFTPLDPLWLKGVAAMKATDQFEAVKAELMKRNPDFDGKNIGHKIQVGVVRELDIPVTNVTDISPLRALPGLLRLKCRGSSSERGQLADLSPLEGTKLTFLMISFTRVSDLTPIKDLKLTLLHCQGTKVRDLDLVRRMPLAELHCGNTGVTDLSPLEGMKLTNLDFVATGVSDLTPLKGMELRYLGCHFSKVTNLEPLTGMPLVWLKMEGTRPADIAPLRGMPLKTLDISFQMKRDAEILRSITTLETINGQARDAFWKEVDAKKGAK